MREYFLLALMGLIVLGILFFIGYFIVYRLLFKGQKSLSWKKLSVGGLFIGYVLMVIGVTFFNRGPNLYGGMDLSLFITYREAWYNFSVRHWQFVILNIFMFVPFGVLLPLLHTRFQKAFWTIGAAFLFTLSIESFQLVTGYGNFVIDDLFNNTLGAVIGYGLLMGLIKLRKRELKRSLNYFSPVFLVIILFASIFTYYHFKEFGNLSITAIHKANMAEAVTTIDMELGHKRTTVPVYRAPSYSRAAADEFVIDFAEKINVDTSNMDVIYYQDEGVYWIYDENSHNIWFRFLDGSYRYTDFSSFNERLDPEYAGEEALIDELTKFGIQVPEGSLFQQVETGRYMWTVEKKTNGNQLTDGELLVSYYRPNSKKAHCFSGGMNSMELIVSG